MKILLKENIHMNTFFCGGKIYQKVYFRKFVILIIKWMLENIIQIVLILQLNGAKL